MKTPSNKLLPADEFGKALAGYRPVSPRYEAILKSWQEHPSKGELWRSLEIAAANHAMPAPQPADFIGVVLGCTMPAPRLNDHSENALNRFEKLKSEITQVVKDAYYPLNLWRDLQSFEESLRELDRSDYDLHASAAGGRNDLNDSRDRKLFAQRMFRYLKGSCGEHLVKEVTVMLNIIFPTDTDDRTAREWLSEASPRPAV